MILLDYDPRSMEYICMSSDAIVFLELLSAQFPFYKKSDLQITTINMSINIHVVNVMLDLQKAKWHDNCSLIGVNIKLQSFLCTTQITNEH